MESRKLAALLSALISELLLALLLLFPSSSPLSLTSDEFTSSLFAVLLPVIRQFASVHEAAASIPPASRKRKRAAQLHEPDPGGHAILAGGRDFLDPNRSLDSYINSFNMTASTFEWLSGLLDPLLDCRDPVGSPLNLSTEFRLGIGLFRLATGSSYSDISRRFGVSKATSQFCVKQLCRVLCTNFRFWVAFPGPNELEPVSRGFESVGGLPNCCGTIGCARFGLLMGRGRVEENIAAQIVVDSSNRILSIIAGFRGNKTESRVLEQSSLYEDIESKRLLSSSPINVNGVSVNQYLVGGEGYPLLPWLMVPFTHPDPGSVQESFNSAHHSMLFPVLRAISSLRNWGVLSKPIEEDFRTAVAYIGACSILHNALLMREDYSSLSDGLGDYQIHSRGFRDYSVSGEAVETRNALAGLLKGPSGSGGSSSPNA
ncbi:hypothetical protein CRG98_046085 [Punica granatum]|uniref:DDE Tnp4 domain-containing protein n=1 Tax=Punica granatum TaxID=22663 RepID=A0A2I0HP75_PUNGR|nr:hypothetical protein CRG98_046085 [Punica granatum]